MIPLLPLLALLVPLGAAPARAQEFEVPAVAPPAPQAAQPTAPRRTPPRRARPRNPRDRAWMDGGVPGTGGTPGANGFGGFAGVPQPVAPRPELAPRPNLDLEGPRVGRSSLAESGLEPALINPRLPGRGVAQDGAYATRENRLFQNPAPGLRLTTPMAW
ncbi:hypothetical protein [Sabulicella glaciei]|uniref:Translation initiation factor IF-2 n=1 Tax=Sabulicella glaciei TaxID=2984948 RepID=A0ABT3NY08_9PROT|nr:hypothetical protein [Roseococcus sp. MDT2-1-1]MCW8087044.1 hypothetical protein [Roseococcus sp. MDT2-1-1]